MNLHISTELIDEVVAEALRHVDRRCAQYNLRVQNSEEYLLAQIDAKLIVQVLINLINNAIKYTPPGTEIDIAWGRLAPGLCFRYWARGFGSGKAPYLRYVLQRLRSDRRQPPQHGARPGPVQVDHQCPWRRNCSRRPQSPWSHLHIFCTCRGGRIA